MDGRFDGLSALSGLDDPVRRQLYQVVVRSPHPVGRDAAAAAAGIGRPLAAYHLDKLVELGLLTAAYQRPPGREGPGAGRPAKVYSRSEREFTVTVPPREYELAARLLAVAVESDREGSSRTALGAAARDFGTSLAARGREASTAKAGRRQAMQSVLRQHGFEPAEDEAGRTILRNCPFHQLAAQHQELVCGMNLALVQGLVAGLDAPGLRPSLDPLPGRCCVVIGAERSLTETSRTDIS